ncbi:centrosomal protein of 295 kDa isoform X4 [Polyodon spathula]|uniref:centrosomal protein of 295 kDa isoform X4 n=1 Tax=Polyodon spathula TaxID=7913 RepID=UPI001B7F0FE6|nr:centrosomal protein of 295 kDa isoform X4 [Polyodon spathula]
MKRKVAKKVGKLRLSPNEEAQILKEELERRRKLRLQQVREQERYIALQVRKEVKQRRDRELQNLAEELRVEWQREQAEKARALEIHYLNSLEAVGEGHRGAKENEPDWAAIARNVAASNQKAEERHKEALKDLKAQRQKQLEEQTRYIKTRKQALLLEKERASRVASLPTPKDPLENIEVKKHPAVKMYDVNSFSVTHYHLPEPCVNREVDTEQLDARVAAEEESKRLDELQKEEEQERREQLEKARLRGGHALRMVHLAQDRERLMKELEQMQHADLNRRRQVVAQMPLQLFEPPYRRLEIKEDWQRDLEFAFEDMYAGDKKLKGDLVLRLEPEPLPAPSTGSQDEDLDLTLEPEAAVGTEEGSEESEPVSLPCRTEVGPEQDLTRQAVSKQALKKLFSKIRTQRDQWTSRKESETASEAMTIDSGSLASQVVQHPTSSVLRNDDQLQHQALIHHPEVSETMEEEPIVAGSTTLLHPREQAIQIRSAAQRKEQEEELELKKQQQIILLQQLEAQKRSLEIHLQKAQLEKEQIQARMQDNRKTNVNSQAPYEEEHAPSVVVPEQIQAFPPSLEDDHLQKIHRYQKRLLEQNRLHKQSVEEARRRLEEYQIMLKKRYPSLSTVPLELSAAYTSSGLISKAEVELTLQRKQPNLPPGPLNLQKPEWQEQREALHSRLTALGEKCSECSLKGGELRGIHLSQTENNLQPEMLFVHPIPTPHFNNGALGSDSQQMQTHLSHLNTEMRALKDVGMEQHTERHLEPSMLPISQAEPVHMAIQGTSDSEMTEVDIGRFIEVSKNDVVLLEAQSPELLMGTFEPQCQRSLIVYPEDSSFPKPSESPGDQESQLASLVEIQARQGQLRELQEQLNRQREALQSRQRVQEESLTYKQDQLKEHMKRQQEALKMFLTDKQFKQTAAMPKTSKAEQFNLMSSMLQALEKADCTLDESHSIEHQSNMPSQENENKMPSCYHQTFMQSGTTSQNICHGQDHQLSRRLKPPVAKPRLGLLEVIEQHELSAIQEVETPISDSLLIGGDDKHDFSVAMDGGMKEETGVSKLSLESKEGSCSESSKDTGRLSRLSWREMLMMETRTFSDQAPSSDPTHSVAVDLPSYSADVGRGVLSYPGPVISRFKSSNKVMHPRSHLDPLFISFQKTSEQDCLSSTTISTGSLSTNEQDISSTDVSLQSTQRMQGRYWAGKAGIHSSTSVFMTSSPECPGAIETSVPVSHGTESRLNGSRIQRIIDKYTKELNQSLDAGNGSPAEMDISDSDFHLPLRIDKPDSSLQFQALESRPDYSISMSTSSQQSRIFENLSEDSNTSTQRNMTVFSAEQLRVNSPTGPEAEAPDVSNEITVGHIQGNITFAPPARLDISDFEDSNFHLPPDFSQNFQTLEPRLDFDSSSMQSQRHSVVSDTTSQRSLTGSNAKQETTSETPNVSSELTLGSVQDNNTLGELRISDLPYSNLNSPHDSRQLFQALEPRPDFAIATFSSSQQSQRHAGIHSCEDHLEDSDISVQRCLIWSNAEQLPSGPVTLIPEVSRELTVGSIQDDTPAVDPTSDSSCLQSDSALNENSQNVECPAAASLTAERLPEQVRLGNMISSASSQYLQQGMVQDEEFVALAEISQNDTEFSRLSETSLEHLRRQSQECPHDQQQESFYQLASTQSTIGDSVLCEPQIADSLKCDFAEKVKDKHHLHSLNGLQSGLSDLHSNDCRKPVSQQSGPHSTSSKKTVGQAANDDELKLKDLVEQHSITETSKDLGTFKSNFSIPVWETESGTGILEEPELTLMSLNETTMLEQELSNSNMEETTGNRSVKPTCMSENLQLNTEVNKSKPLTEGFQSSKSKTSHAVMLVEFSSSPGSLQEIFLKKKKDLIQKSSKRVEMIKTRERPLAVKTPESLPKGQNSQNRAEVPSYAQVCQLKKVGEVKVCTPEQRNTNETEMYRRTERLYNQLDEVRHRKHIKMTEEAYAKNREKAKEFQKKTLQKLRAKQMKC